MFKNEYPFQGIMKDLLEIRKIYFFFILCFLTFLLLFIKKTFIVYEISAFQILDERGQLGVFKLISSLQYLSIPVIYLFKFTIIAFFVWVGCFGFGYRVTYSECWHVVLVAEIIFILPELLKIFWFLYFETDPNYSEVKAFYPLSLINLVNFEQVGKQWHYPLKSINVFEVIYWFLLAVGIYIKSGKVYKQSLVIASFGYVLPFLFWLVYYTIVYK